MSDIEELMRTMGAHIDTIDPRPPSLARHAGTKRRRTRRIAWASLLILAFLSASGGIILLNRPAPPIVSPTPDPSLGKIVPLHEIGPGISYGPGGMTGQPRITIRQNRAFAVWTQSDSTFVVVGIDLRTGQELWRHHAQEHGERVTLSGSNEVLTATYVKPGSLTGDDKQLIAFDSSSGSVLWRAPVTFSLLQFGGTVVVDNRQDVTGLDLRTGEKLWTLASGQDTRIAPLVSSADSSQESRRKQSDSSGEHGLAILGSEGRLRFVNTDTGEVTLDTRVSGSREFASLIVIDGNALVSDNTRIRSVSNAGEKVIYTAPAGQFIRIINACGAGRLCTIAETAQGYTVSLIDFLKGELLWQVQIGSAEPSAVPFINQDSGRYYLTSIERTQLLDERGKQVAVFDHRQETPVFLGSGLVLHMVGDLQSPSIQPISFSIGGLAAKTSTPIGKLTVFGNYCTPTESAIVCATADKVKVWRYRAD